MKSLKTLFLGTTLAAGTLFFMGTSAHADEAYTVQSGDTLSTISQKYVGDNSLIQTIAEHNSISNINLIYSGQQLTIPTGDQAAGARNNLLCTSRNTSTTSCRTCPTRSSSICSCRSSTTCCDETAAPATSSSAKEWIAQRESSGSYTATNGRYIGRYQLDASYLNGDYSAANQERVADQYVTSRYGSWDAAQAFWLANGWY